MRSFLVKDFYFSPGGLTSIDYSSDWPLWQKHTDQSWHLFPPVLMLSYAGFAGLSRHMVREC
jgi:ABC-type dipeptide/oligopeptide/nickel transport system permease component